jgi:hypothetical protein
LDAFLRRFGSRFEGKKVSVLPLRQHRVGAAETAENTSHARGFGYAVYSSIKLVHRESLVGFSCCFAIRHYCSRPEWCNLAAKRDASPIKYILKLR